MLLQLRMSVAIANGVSPNEIDQYVAFADRFDKEAFGIIDIYRDFHGIRDPQVNAVVEAQIGG